MWCGVVQFDVMQYHVMQRRVMYCNALLSLAMWCHGMFCCIMLCSVTSYVCYAMAYAMLCCVVLSYTVKLCFQFLLLTTDVLYRAVFLLRHGLSYNGFSAVICPAMLCYLMVPSALTCYILWYDVMIYCANSSYVEGCVRLCYAMSCVHIYTAL